MLRIIIVLLLVSGCSANLKEIKHDKTAHLWKLNSVLVKEYPTQGVGSKTMSDAKFALKDCKGTYVTDLELYGKDEYWATPSEYRVNDKKGDCEDFALCVYYKLRELGFEEKDLNLIAGNFNNGSHVALDIKVNNQHYIADVNYNYLIDAADYYDKVFKLSIYIK